jgi:hypothetical protein
MRQYAVMARYPSKSKAGETHEVRIGKDRAVYCTCTGWRIRKRCKHLDEFLGELDDSGRIDEHIRIHPGVSRVMCNCVEYIVAADCRHIQEFMDGLPCA